MILKEELEKLLFTDKLTYSEIGRRFNVSFTAVKKWAKYYGLVLPLKRKINPNEIFSHNGTGPKSLVNNLDDSTFIEIITCNHTWADISSELGYKAKNLSSNVKIKILERCKSLGIELLLDKKKRVNANTKGELFEKRKNWQSARSSIEKDARKVYYSYYPEIKCAICGYDKHIDIAHIKGVSEFSKDSTLLEINDIKNLIGLCPNHHWEYDHGFLEKEEIIKAKSKMEDNSILK